MNAIQSGKKRSRTRSDETLRKHRSHKPEKTGREQAIPAKQVAQVVSGEGTDADIEARCAEGVDGWESMGKRTKADMVRLMRHFWTLPAAPRMAVEKNHQTGTTHISVPTDSNVTANVLRLIEALGSNSDAFTNNRVSDLVSHLTASNSTGCSTEALSSALAFVHGGKATDPVQSSLLVQMVATHDAALRALRMMSGANFVPQAQLFGNLATKLLNTYTRQAEALSKLQRGGEQVIKHIHIDNRGGQAVVTDQVITGGSQSENGNQAHEPCATLLGAHESWDPLSVSCDEGQEAVLSARRR